MDSKGAAAAVPTQVYEDFVPTTELVQEQDSDTLLLNLTGFKKEQVRVQLTRTGILKISGQRPVVGQNKSLRFQKDFPAEKTATNSTAQDRNRQNYESKLENDANMGIAARAEKLKMPRKVMNMSLIALLVLGIGLYVSHMMKSAITKFTN